MKNIDCLLLDLNKLLSASTFVDHHLTFSRLPGSKQVSKCILITFSLHECCQTWLTMLNWIRYLKQILRVANFKEEIVQIIKTRKGLKAIL